MKRKKAWRDTFMVERGKITHKKLIHRERMEARKNNLVVTKEQRLAGECSKAEYQPPCKGSQVSPPPPHPGMYSPVATLRRYL